MVIDTLAHRDAWRGLHPRLGEGLEFLRTADLAALPLGRHEIEGERLFAIVDEYVTRPPERCRLEAHRRYHDIQYLVSGRERIGYAPLERVRIVEPHDEARDVAFFDGEYDTLTLHPGTFAIFAPHDVHAPQMMIDRPEQVRKVVVKVEVG